MIKRDAAGILELYLKTFPVTLVVGPRQCGKTTLVKSHLASWKFFDLERAADNAAVSFDIDGFLESNPSSVVIDEAQKLPELFSTLRAAVDKDRRPGRYVLTGSASPSLIKGVSESLAGRIGILELAPFGASELRALPSEASGRWFWGGYPPLYHLRSARQRAEWLEAYISTFVERDIPSLGFSIPSVRFRKFLYMLAHVHGGILNVMDLARSMAVSQHTVEHYLDILEGAFIIRRLQPYFANIGKRLVKSPKLYIRDSGLFNYLAGLRNPAELELFPRRGSSWEGMVVEEIARLAALKYAKPGVYYWRTHGGAEADLIIEAGLEKTAVEIKLGGAVKSESLAGLKSCMTDLKIRKASVIYTGEQLIDLGGGIKLVPWAEFLKRHVLYI